MNMVKIVDFDSESDLFYILDDLMESTLDEDDDFRCYHLKNIQMISEGKALLYFEEDLDKLLVRFHKSGKLFDFGFRESIFYFSLDEIKLMDSLGEVTIKGNTYDIEKIKYNITDNGLRFVDIFLF